ncbi:glucose-1-phosphate adenylyltransferase [Halobacillus karajensis]|uniref:Glucose-1-phosphate adenylyltransferase n=1 Tax=Halobacillus karajensis TaxID=195088 RepID=A0A059NZ73_9BACI|nr:glucose-1-phosphate adenylyltransferase [Halobacillus karajensis]CDQ18571.1 Glucose-1-phosphate adenylyltransferase [Halobacillus karajensis]CDQ23357.1 Glucose-1-phosphate adenylyltransferase [Halobacillus karajensis]CDQ26839.1 Glucose-1-phosphate adenylyltransferase [Halobacillus karajensis]SEH49761.1 glucose-1-phosphate adenylyltransferase [Halobacillus karajensis]
MKNKECVAMLLAGGQGTRLKSLTKQIAKPAVYFGGKYRIIDFPLSNCTNSGIDTVGVLTQYEPLILNDYIGIGDTWDLDRKYGGVSVLPPFMEAEGGGWYTGTANAIYRNLKFLNQYDPEHVLVLSGDHIYKMDYNAMLDYHKGTGADATISVIEVPWVEANRFGIMNTDEEGRITEFDEKPDNPKSNLASMGVYIFRWDVLKQYLLEDAEKENSSHDFGKDIIPSLLYDYKKLMAYTFEGYWKDVGTVDSLWEANMDLLKKDPELDLNDQRWRIYSKNPNQPPQYIAPTAHVRNALINEGCRVYGTVDTSIIFYGVHICESSIVKDSVIMPDVKIGKNVKINRAIVSKGSVIEDGAVIGDPSPDSEITLVADEGSVLAASLATHT